MAKLNKRDAMIKGLKAIGYVEVESRSRKYLAFRDRARTALVGRSGALLMTGSDGKVTGARSFTGGHLQLTLILLGAMADQLVGGKDQVTTAYAELCGKSIGELRREVDERWSK